MQSIKTIRLAVFLLLSLFFITTPAISADKIIKETQTHNVFKGALLSIWSKFKQFNPHNKQIAKSKTVYTAGIRGAESTGTLIQPYWKDDLTQDPNFKKELEHYGKAITWLNNGNLNQANDSLSSFISSFPQSTLKPNALFAQGMSMAGLGNYDNASRTFKEFISAYPSHPLAKDADAVLNELN